MQRLVKKLEAEKERQRKLNSMETLIFMQKEIIKDAQDFEEFTDYDFTELNNALTTLENLRRKM